MHFGHPEFLWLLLLWPVLAWMGWLALARRRKMAARLGEAGLIERLYPESIRRWRRRRVLLLLAAMALMMFAAARPQYGRVVQTMRSVGTNVLVAVDCSRSMQARDVVGSGGTPASRLEAARESLKWLLTRLEGNRVGIIAFAGEAVLHCPMTLDHELAALVLESIDAGTIGLQGTDMGRAIEVAAQAFERGAGAGGRALVLITDGEDNEGRGLEAARKAKEQGVRIYAIGIGSPRGAPLAEERGGFKEDTQGRKVNTRLDMAALEQIAQATGGLAVEAGASPGRAIMTVAERIAKEEKTELESQRRVTYQDRFQWFLGPALVLILILLLYRPEQMPVAKSAGKQQARPGVAPDAWHAAARPLSSSAPPQASGRPTPARPVASSATSGLAEGGID